MARRSSVSKRKKGYRSRNLNFNRNQGSGRTLALAAILFMLALFLAPPVKNYFVQRAQISALQSQLNSDYSALDAARKELTLWQDPEYVKSQARERLHFVMPGERQYIVTGTDGSTTDEATQTDVVTNLPEGQPWYTRMIASITEAGKA
ncbi:MAG: septum formation initiator family protein [Candidatus Planktophila sp.]|jgi:cell division protein FtsB|tara:strand:+ start:318 stop:764 length:447 start_codon:yes stop_codon:yes gene_type:complete